jgi:hypothetical protein
MTTTLDKNISTFKIRDEEFVVISKKDYLKLKSNSKKDFDIDFRMLNENEISDDLRKKFEESKKKPLSSFTNLTKEYA